MKEQLTTLSPGEEKKRWPVMTEKVGSFFVYDSLKDPVTKKVLDPIEYFRCMIDCLVHAQKHNNKLFEAKEGNNESDRCSSGDPKKPHHPLPVTCFLNVSL